MVGVRGAAQPRSVASALARARVVAAVVLAGGNQLLESINEGPKALNKGGDVDKLDRAVGSHDRSRLELGNGSDALRDEGLKVGPQPLLALAEHTAERVGKLDPRKLGPMPDRRPEHRDAELLVALGGHVHDLQDFAVHAVEEHRGRLFGRCADRRPAALLGPVALSLALRPSLGPVCVFVEEEEVRSILNLLQEERHENVEELGVGLVEAVRLDLVAGAEKERRYPVILPRRHLPARRGNRRGRRGGGGGRGPRAKAVLPRARGVPVEGGNHAAGSGPLRAGRRLRL
mmetsp:Transcript_22354/g.53434  ORF Transcript_22354/g.53434 Transcript_22354/m.53434 type:complete len:288 (-) Transcript_22354:1967-2830(-)